MTITTSEDEKDTLVRKPETLSATDLAPAISRLKKILVPLDLSAASEKALRYAVPFAKQFGAKIILFHAIEPLPYPADLTYAPLGEVILIEPTRERLGELAKSIVEPELLDQCMVHIGIAFELIVDFARQLNVDLIVITTHGYTGLKRVLLGSTAERIVRHAPCPVLVVREREHDFV
ncbi:MAG: uspa protein [Chthoniobacteraceae bacterium]|nr:uspa protein [Chthoniobacteraceae bacterium]